MLLNTMTVVGIGESNLANDNNLVKTSRNCSSCVPTWRISFSLALPTKVKFLEVTLVQVSFGLGVWLWTAVATMKTRSVAAALNVRQFIVRPHPETGQVIDGGTEPLAGELYRCAILGVNK